MRAPPVAVKLMNGVFCSIAVSTPRTKRSPTTEPIEPPMKSNSKQAATTGIAHHRAAHDDQRIGLAGGLERVLQPLGVLLAVLELQRIDRQHLLADLVAALGIEEGVEPRARADAVVVAALRADVEVLLEVGLVEHRLARRALDPQALGHRAALARVGRLDLRRQQFFEPAHAMRSFDRGVERGADLGDEARAPRAATLSRGSRLEQLDQRDADDDRIGDRGHGARRRRVADAEADADRHLHVRLDARHHLRDRVDVEVAGTGHALQRHVVDVAARDAADAARCAASVEVGASRKIGSMPVRLAAARRSLRTPRADSRRRARRRRRRRARRRRSAPTP